MRNDNSIRLCNYTVCLIGHLTVCVRARRTLLSSEEICAMIPVDRLAVWTVESVFCIVCSDIYFPSNFVVTLDGWLTLATLPNANVCKYGACCYLSIEEVNTDYTPYRLQRQQPIAIDLLQFRFG